MVWLQGRVWGREMQEYDFIQTHISIPNTFLIALKFNLNSKSLMFVKKFLEIPKKLKPFNYQYVCNFWLIWGLYYLNT